MKLEIGYRVVVSSDWWEAEEFWGTVAPYPDDPAFLEDGARFEGHCRIVPGTEIEGYDEKDYQAYWIKFDLPQKSIDDDTICEEAEVMASDLEVIGQEKIHD